MPYEMKEGDISVFINDKKGNEKRPDFKGSALIGGKEYEVALWKKESKSGKKFLSGSMKQLETVSGGTEKSQKTTRTCSVEDNVPW